MTDRIVWIDECPRTRRSDHPWIEAIDTMAIDTHPPIPVFETATNQLRRNVHRHCAQIRAILFGPRKKMDPNTISANQKGGEK